MNLLLDLASFLPLLADMNRGQALTEYLLVLLALLSFGLLLQESRAIGPEGNLLRQLQSQGDQKIQAIQKEQSLPITFQSKGEENE